MGENPRTDSRPEDVGIEGEGADGLSGLLTHFASGWDAHVGCGRGWFPLLSRTHEQLQDICPDYEVHQVKEKFGTLRLYAHIPPGSAVVRDPNYPAIRDAFFAAVQDAEYASGTICEGCGNMGRLMRRQQGGWFKTLCSSCAADSGYIEGSSQCGGEA
jgi:hypothetical protein